MKGIVWLASYPKSGNTWFRVFLANLLSGHDQPVRINALGGLIASNRAAFDEALGYDSSEMAFDEIDRLRPDFYLCAARSAKGTIFCKVHDAYVFLPDGRAMFPAAATASVLYFIRNPLDVCVSLAIYSGHDGFDRVIADMADVSRANCDKRSMGELQLRQRLLTWSEHVQSWVNAPALRVHVVRYEDMKLRPEETFVAAAQFVGLPDDLSRVKKAIEFSRFEELRRQEEREGFGEKQSSAKGLFFRKGKIGSWRDSLTSAQVKRVIADHGVVMRRFGYLDAEGRPVF